MKINFKEKMLNNIFYSFKDCLDCLEFEKTETWVVPFFYTVTLKNEDTEDYEEAIKFFDTIMSLTKFGEMKCQKIILDYKNKKISIQNFDESTKDILQTDDTLKVLFNQLSIYFKEYGKF
jgi:hypothetical protein